MTEILIYGEIGLDVTAKGIAEQLKALDPKEPVVFRINSPGGSITEGLAIFNLIQSRKDTFSRVDGICASIATIIALAAEKVLMAENALFFVHNALIVGNIEATASELREIANGLDVNENVIVRTYLKKTKDKANEETIRALMKDNTFLEASEALDYGFIDEVIDASSVELVNKYKGRMLNTFSMSKDTEIKNEVPEVKNDAPAPVTPKEEVAPAWAVKLQESLDALNTKLDAFMKEDAAEDAEEDKPVEPVAKAPEAVAKVEPVAVAKTVRTMKAIRTPVDVSEKTFADMTVSERANFVAKKFIK